MMTLFPTDLNRRVFLAGSVSVATLTFVTTPVWAITAGEAEGLVDRVVSDINRIISSGKTESAMLHDFEKIFTDYAYISGISRTVLGPPARSASDAEMRAFTKAFQAYMGRKYGKRFREFIGGRIEVKGAKKVKSFYEVTTKAILAGEAPFTVTFMVSDVSGNGLFFDMLIEGISLLKVEKSEIGAMLDKRRGNLGQMIEDLKKAG